MGNDTPPKKKLKKKKKVKPVIPKTLTANIGELRRNEMKDEPPEEFVNTAPKKAPPPPPKTESSSSESANFETIKSTPSGSKETSISKGSTRLPKVYHGAKEDKVIEYKIDIGRTYSQSSGTLSYDSCFVPDQGKFNTYRALGSLQKHPDQNVQQTKKVEVVGKFEDVIPFDSGTFSALVKGEHCPPGAGPTPEYLCGRREIQLAKDAINTALDEYLATDRDDLDLIVRVQRRGPFPIVSLTVTTNPRCNMTTSVASDSAGSTTTTSSAAQSASTIVASTSDATTARSFTNLVSSAFNLLVGVIRPCIKPSP